MKIAMIAMTATCALVISSFNPADAAQRRRAEQSVDLDPTGRGATSGIGIESRDIDMMSDQIVRELMSRPDIVGTPTPPRIVVDSERFFNQSSQRIDRDMITDALRISLSRAAAGRIRFVSRESMAIVERERELKRQGQVDTGTRGLTRASAGVDYQLVGRMTSLDSRDTGSGTQQRRTQVIFELVDLETAEIVWTGPPYVILRAGTGSVVYR